MTFLIVKYAVTALLVVVVSEVAKRSDRAGALIASLPLGAGCALTFACFALATITLRRFGIALLP
jgi:hypothetical protein